MAADESETFNATIEQTIAYVESDSLEPPANQLESKFSRSVVK